MAIKQLNKRVLHRKEPQMMSPALLASGAGAFIVKDPVGNRRNALHVGNATSQYMYDIEEDAWLQLPSFALAGTFGAGACGGWGLWSTTFTATTGGSTTKAITTTALSSLAVGRKIRFLTGANAGEERTITEIKINVGTNSELILDSALGSSVSNGDTFAIDSGRYYILNAGTLASGSFKSYDPLTGVVTTLANANLPATWGTDGKLVGTPSYVGAFATGTATAGAGSTLTNSAKAWATNQWTNYQIRITAGTGKGQVRTIASNTGTVITVSSAWTVTPDATSVYAIEGNDDYLYLLGNNAVTMYRYSISANAWSVMAPTVARAGAMATGGSANWIAKSGNTQWADENNILDGRYIYSFRGGATSTLDRFDIAGGTAGAGAWANIPYVRQQETFTTGSGYDYIGNGKIIIRKDNTNRFFYIDVVGNIIYPFTTDFLPDGAGVVGDKMFSVSLQSEVGDDPIDWIYYLANTSTVLRRIMII